MKKYLVTLVAALVVSGTSFASVEGITKGGKSGKHHSHKKAKKKKSSYFFNFQH